MDRVEQSPPAKGSTPAPIRCAQFHAAQSVDPAGTASHWDAVLVVEVPGPWPRDISGIAPFSELADPPSATATGADGRIWRLQGVLPADATAGMRVMAHERPGGGVGPFGRREWLLPPGSPEPAVSIGRSLLSGDESALGSFSGFRDDPDPETVDLLLCTHGTRDACCGGPGTKLYKKVSDAVVEQPPEVRERVRLWRSSHEGGHRFAPTALTFPEGVSWAHLDRDAVLAILSRDPRVENLSGHMKGAVSIDAPRAQVADREGFVRHGWRWLTAPRTVSAIAADDPDELATVEVSAALADGPTATVRTTVGLAGHIPKPPCGVLDPVDVPEEPVWRVVRTDTVSR